MDDAEEASKSFKICKVGSRHSRAHELVYTSCTGETIQGFAAPPHSGWLIFSTPNAQFKITEFDPLDRRGFQLIMLRSREEDGLKQR